MEHILQPHREIPVEDDNDAPKYNDKSNSEHSKLSPYFPEPIFRHFQDFCFISYQNRWILPVNARYLGTETTRVICSHWINRI